MPDDTPDDEQPADVQLDDSDANPNVVAGAFVPHPDPGPLAEAVDLDELLDADGNIK